jgi:excisionase family DNA binding protein
MPDKLMDINELSTYLKLEKQTLYNWLHQRKIPGIKVGGVWRFQKRTVDKWLASQTIDANPDSNHKRTPKARLGK